VSKDDVSGHHSLRQTGSLTVAALELAELGVPVFPLKANKRPCQDGGFKVATTDLSVVARLFADPLASLIGVPTGAVSGFDTLDIDPKNGGNDWLRENEHRLPDTTRVQTRSGGVHFRFAHSPGVGNSASRIAPGVDVRGDGGYVVAWDAHGFGTSGVTHAAWPAWLLLANLRNINPNTPVPAAEDLSPPDAASLLALLDTMPNPESVTRDDYTAVNLAVQGCIRSLESLGRDVDPSAVYDAAAEWSSKWDSGGASSFEIERARWDEDWSLRDRDISGWKHLLGLAQRFGADVSVFTLATAAAEFGALPPEPYEASEASEPSEASTPAVTRRPIELSVSEDSEDAVADGFAKDMHREILYDHSTSAWVAWAASAGLWRRDETGRGPAAIRMYIRQARALFGGTNKAMASASFISAVERLAKNDPRLAVSSAVWDTDPWLLGVPGGVVDLRTGEVLPGDPARRITKQTAVAPAAPGTPAPLWQSFLVSATGDDNELIGYLQRFAGYCLTGDISEEIFAFLYGEGGGGKGTFCGAVQAVMGAYGLRVSIDTFSANSRQNPEYARASMAGARMVTASETKNNSGWDEASLKEFSGNEGAISAREPYGKIFEYSVQFKIAILGNYAPSTRGRDKAMERRLHVVPFDHKPARPDTKLKDKLRAEYPAILRWMIDGCLAWQRDGLKMCSAVEIASAAYFEEQDSVQAWANECLVLAGGLRTKRSELVSDYNRWLRENNEKAVSAQAFCESARRLLRLTDKMVNGIRLFDGAALKGRDAAIPAAEFSDVSALLG
jgi:putative DNA primase/helicase